jgi:hypothetical protein
MDQETEDYLNRLLQTINRILDMEAISQKTIIILTERLIKLESKIKKLEKNGKKKKK